MKYHTTLSTIIISLIVLMCFALASLMCVFALGIDSPGYMIATQAMQRLARMTDLDISYSSIGRNLSSSVVIDGISISSQGDELISIDKVTIYRNPFQLIRAFMTGEGRLSVDITGVEVNLEGPSDTEGGDGQPMTLEEVNGLIRSIESYDDILKDMAFYGLEYSINIEDFTLNLAELSFTDLRMNLVLDSGLDLVRFVFNAPVISITLADASLDAANLSLSLTRGEEYVARASLDAIRFSYGDIQASMANMALSLPFRSFGEIDLFHLPIVLSATQSTFRSTCSIFPSCFPRHRAPSSTAISGRILKDSRSMEMKAVPTSSLSTLRWMAARSVWIFHASIRGSTTPMMVFTSPS